MKYLTLMKLLLITSFMLNPVHANEIAHPFYFNGGFRHTFGPDYDLNRLYVGLGYQQQYWAVEAELGSGVGDDTVRENGVTVDVDSEFGYGIYALARYPFGGIGSDFFLRLGYEDLGVDTRGDSLGSNDSLAGAAYGFGFHVFKFRWGGYGLNTQGPKVMAIAYPVLMYWFFKNSRNDLDLTCPAMLAKTATIIRFSLNPSTSCVVA